MNISFNLHFASTTSTIYSAGILIVFLPAVLLVNCLIYLCFPRIVWSMLRYRPRNWTARTIPTTLLISQVRRYASAHVFPRPSSKKMQKKKKKIIFSVVYSRKSPWRSIVSEHSFAKRKPSRKRWPRPRERILSSGRTSSDRGPATRFNVDAPRTIPLDSITQEYR